MSIFSSVIRRIETAGTQMRIRHTERIGSHVQKVTLSFSRPPEQPFEIGCYIQPMIAGCIPRAYSVVEWTGQTCTIIVSFSGRGVGARFFASAPVGTTVNVYGPFSDFPFHAGTGRPKLFLATGTGVAPFVAMATEAVREQVPSLLVLGVPREEDIPYREHFDALARRTGTFQALYTLSRPSGSWGGARGHITEQFHGPWRSWFHGSDIYVCGVPGMVEATLKMLRDAGVAKGNVFVQKFG